MTQPCSDALESCSVYRLCNRSMPFIYFCFENEEERDQSCLGADRLGLQQYRLLERKRGGIWENPDFQHGHISTGRRLRSLREKGSHLLPTGDDRELTGKKAGEGIFPSLRLRYIPSYLNNVYLLGAPVNSCRSDDT